LTSEQLEAARAERMRQNGNGALTLEEARTWIEETGLCLFLPRRQYSSSVAPSFVEAVVGLRDAAPDPRQTALAEDLLVRLELDDVVVRLNLLGQPGEQPDYIVASWVLPYVYALRGDRDWRRSPQLTGSRQVSQLAVQAYKQLEAGDATISQLRQALGREVSESAVLRAITELWQQLRIIPVISAPGQAAKWQLLRHRFQKAIAEGASTSQVTAISVLASIYLQAVIAASMEDVEMFLASLTARSKVREVLRGLVATRQVHTISMGHAPHFYVAGTLPEFTPAPTIYASSSMLSSGYFSRDFDHEEEAPEVQPVQPEATSSSPAEPLKPVESHVSRTPVRKPSASAKPGVARPHFGRTMGRSRDRKPGQSTADSRPARRAGEARPSAGRSQNGSRAASGVRWGQGVAKSSNGKHEGARGKADSSSKGARSNSGRPANGSTAPHTAKPSAPALGKRNGHAGSLKSAARPGTNGRNSGLVRKDSRSSTRPKSGSREPALTAGAAGGNGKRFGYTNRAKQGTKKRG